MAADSARIESDSMGQMQVPNWALWGAQTQRAVENFPVSGYRFDRRFIRAMGLIKQAAAEVNQELGLLDSERAACTKLLRSMQARYAAAEKDALALLSIGGTPRNQKLNPAEHAAWAQLAITVLASDAAILLY